MDGFDHCFIYSLLPFVCFGALFTVHKCYADNVCLFMLNTFMFVFVQPKQMGKEYAYAVRYTHHTNIYRFAVQ